jgi:hypothetical protein
MPLLEVFGYFASVLITLSIMMSNIKLLRLFNLLGAAAFSVYGYFIDAYPVFILNSLVASVNGYYLIGIYLKKDKFDLIRLKSIDTPMFTLLKESYDQDIKAWCNEFQWQYLDDAVVFVLFKNMKPIGMFAYRELNTKGKIEVVLDYVIPEDRDKNAEEYMFVRKNNQLNQYGIKQLIVKSKNSAHELYLSRVGFTKVNNYFELQLNLD